MKIDRYTRVVLTIIAVGIIGLNIHFFKDDFATEAYAYDHEVASNHMHETWEIDNLIDFVKQVVESCVSYDGIIDCFR